MKVMIVVTAREGAPAPSEAQPNGMHRYNSALAHAGVLLAGDCLEPTARAKRVEVSGRSRRVVDGPFPTANVAGYWLLQVRSMDEAVAWALRCPNPWPGEDVALEVRPVLEAGLGAQADLR
jgi:hypothetical protein